MLTQGPCPGTETRSICPHKGHARLWKYRQGRFSHFHDLRVSSSLCHRQQREWRGEAHLFHSHHCWALMGASQLSCARTLQLPHLFPPSPATRASSPVLPRPGAGPVLLSVAAVKEWGGGCLLVPQPMRGQGQPISLFLTGPI